MCRVVSGNSASLYTIRAYQWGSRFGAAHYIREPRRARGIFTEHFSGFRDIIYI